jgi:hypothetical protein
MKGKAKLKKLSDVLIDLAKVVFITFVIGHFISPNVISCESAIVAGVLATAILTLAIIVIPEEEKK